MNLPQQSIEKSPVEEKLLQTMINRLQNIASHLEDRLHDLNDIHDRINNLPKEIEESGEKDPFYQTDDYMGQLNHILECLRHTESNMSSTIIKITKFI